MTLKISLSLEILFFTPTFYLCSVTVIGFGLNFGIFLMILGIKSLLASISASLNGFSYFVCSFALFTQTLRTKGNKVSRKSAIAVNLSN